MIHSARRARGRRDYPFTPKNNQASFSGSALYLNRLGRRSTASSDHVRGPFGRIWQSLESTARAACAQAIALVIACNPVSARRLRDKGREESYRRVYRSEIGAFVCWARVRRYSLARTFKASVSVSLSAFLTLTPIIAPLASRCLSTSRRFLSLVFIVVFELGW